MIPAVTGKAAPSARADTRRLLLVAVVVILGFGLLRSIFSHHDSAYEKIAGQLTVALQKNDLAAVEKFQNSETATYVTHGVVGRAADRFAPLGKLDRVRETAVEGRTHQFDAVFDKGTVHETIRFDPDNKVVGFKYDLPTPK